MTPEAKNRPRLLFSVLFRLSIRFQTKERWAGATSSRGRRRFQSSPRHSRPIRPAANRLCEARALGSPPDLIRGKKEANGKTAGMCVQFKARSGFGLDRGRGASHLNDAGFSYECAFVGSSVTLSRARLPGRCLGA